MLGKMETRFWKCLNQCREREGERKQLKNNGERKFPDVKIFGRKKLVYRNI